MFLRLAGLVQTLVGSFFSDVCYVGPKQQQRSIAAGGIAPGGGFGMVSVRGKDELLSFFSNLCQAELPSMLRPLPFPSLTSNPNLRFQSIRV